MSIQKIVKIENVGRFEKLAAAGDVTLRELSLIYGLNGRGKTTIAGLFRSLATGNAAYVAERERLGADAGAQVEILLNPGGLAKYNDGAWSVTESNIEIFDTTFVSENVYAGDHVDPEHRRNLYEVVVGAAAVDLAKQQNELDAAQRGAGKEITKIEGQLREVIHSPFGLEDFIALEPEEGVEESIKETTTKLSSVRKSKEVLARRELEKLEVPELPAQALEVLKVNVEQMSAAAQQAVRDHIDRRLDHAGERWLRQGLQYLGDHDACPFCAQDVDGVDLVASYSDYFSTVYTDHVVALERARNSVNQRLGEDALHGIQNRVLSNKGTIQGWSDLADLRNAECASEELEGAWHHAKSLVLEALQRKLGDPSRAQAEDPALTAAVQDFDDARARLLARNESIDAANGQIGTLKKQAASQSEEPLEQELRRLRNIQIRQKPEVEELCQALTAARTRRKEIGGEKANTKTELEEMAKAVLQEHEVAINRYLSLFGATFSITGTKPSWPGGKTSSTYQILINDHPVDLGDTRTPPGTPCFRTALSAGDKSTLALAFFLARLDRDPDLHEKVVVLDDPLSSLDEFRLACTQQVICDLASRAVQVLVLSHNPFFLKRIYDASEGAKVKVMHIVRRGRDRYCLEGWDIRKACRPESQQAYFNLQSYVEEGVGNGDLRAVAKEIRICLEGVLRTRFPADFGEQGMLGDFIKAIREAPAGSSLAAMDPKVLAELEALNEYARRFHHTGASEGALPEPNDDELHGFVERTLGFVHGAPPP